MSRINQQIHAVRRRLQWFRMLDGLGVGFIAGLAAALLSLAAGRIWPIEGMGWIAGGSVAVLSVACLLQGWLRKVSLTEAARIMDIPQPGRERQDMMTTALDYADEDSLATRLQRSQAEAYGEAYVKALKQRLPLPRPGIWRIAPAAAALLAVILLVVLPNPMHEVIDKQRQERMWIKEQQTETEERLEELEMKQLEPLAKDSLSDELAELRHALEQSREPAEALDQVEETMKRLKEMEEKLDLKQQQRAEMIDALQSHPLTGELARALEQRDDSELAKQMNNLQQSLPGMSKEEQQALSEALRKAAEAQQGTDAERERLAELLKQAAASIASGDQDKSKQTLEDLTAALTEEMDMSGMELEQAAAAAQLASALAQQGLGLAEQMAASGLAVSSTWSMGGSAEQLAAGAMGGGSGGGAGDSGSDGAGQSEGSGSNGSNGSELGSGSGSGAGSGAGTGGAVAGGGSGNGSGTGGSGGNGGSGAGQGSGAGLGSGGRTLVTTPRELAGSGNVQNDGGPSTGGSVQSGGESPIFDGVSRSYEEVYSDYASEARRTLDRSDLPQSMQSLVESYFTEIDPGR